MRLRYTRDETRCCHMCMYGTKCLFPRTPKIKSEKHYKISFVVFHHTDTSLYLLSLALALSIHNKQISAMDRWTLLVKDCASCPTGSKRKGGRVEPARMKSTKASWKVPPPAIIRTARGQQARKHKNTGIRDVTLFLGYSRDWKFHTPVMSHPPTMTLL